MAPDKGNQGWVIWVLVVVAIVFIVLAFKKEKPQEVSVPVAQNVVAEKAKAPESGVQSAAPNMKAQESVVLAPKQVVSKESFAIQVYSFKEKNRADAAILKLKEKGHSNCYIMISDLGARGIFYRVRVGPFSDEGEAQKVLEAINTDIKNGGIIVTE